MRQRSALIRRSVIFMAKRRNVGLKRRTDWHEVIVFISEVESVLFLNFASDLPRYSDPHLVQRYIVSLHPLESYDVTAQRP